MKRTVKRILIVTSVVLLSLVILVIAFASPITKYLVEKYDVKYLGREVKMDWAYVNPFTGYVYFNNVRVYESNDASFGLTQDTVFFSSEGLSMHLSMRKMMSGLYEINSLTFDKPYVRIIQNQNKHDFNFNDIIDKFSSKDSKDTTQKKEPVHFNLLDVKIADGEFHYWENVIPIKYSIRKVNIECTGYRWNSDTIAATFAFEAGIGTGKSRGRYTMDLKKLDYTLAASLTHFDMTLMEQYLKDLSNYGTVRAYFDAIIDAKGNYHQARALDSRGSMTITDFHFGKNKTEDYASFESFTMGINQLNPAKKIYNLDSVILTRPYFKYERYDHLDNLQNMFGKSGSKVKEAHANEEHFNLILEIADYVKKLVKDFFQSNYKMKHLAIRKADLKFNDYAISEKFSMSANPLTIKADSVDKSRSRARLTLATGIQPYGNAELFLSVNPRDSSDFDLNYKIEKVPVALFNPYLISYTSFPMDRGTIELNGNWKVRNGAIQSRNHMLIIDPRIARKVKKKGDKWVPLPLIMAFVRERGNVIDYEIPITGNLKNPRFHIRDVVLDLLANIFIKPPTVPYGLKVSETEKKIEKMLTFKWEMMQAQLNEKQKKFLEKMASFLKKDPQARVQVYPLEYAQKEKEYILLYEARKKYFLHSNHKNANLFTKDDSLAVLKMPVKDSSFIKYLNQVVGKKMMFTVQEKCAYLVGDELVQHEYHKLLKQREQEFREVFKEDGTIGQVKFGAEKAEVPYNGFSYFRIAYPGDLPHELQKAYEELDTLDEEYPRKKYFWERKKLRESLKTAEK